MEATISNVPEMGTATAPIQTAPIQPQVQQVNSQPSESSFLGDVNWLILLGGVTLVTFCAFGIYYYKTQVNVVQKNIKEQNEKIEQLDNEVGEIAATLQPA